MRSISFDRFLLSNGLKVIVHEDFSSPSVVLFVVYDVGSRDEDPDKTGLAHLCEHLMFSGTKDFPNFETLLHQAAGHTNGATTPDYTEYFIQLPADNAEVAFWLESEQMRKPLLNRRNVETQKKIILQEYKEMLADDPYSEAVAQLYSLSYKNHPYQWLPFGKMEHVKQFSLADVQDFISRFYCPNNAVLVVAGNIAVDQARHFAEKWFATIPMGSTYLRDLPAGPVQQKPGRIVIEADVPLNAIYKSFPMPGFTKPGYEEVSFISSILGDGASSRLYKALVREKKLFTYIDCGTNDLFDDGLCIIEGKLAKNNDLEAAEKALEEELQKMVSISLPERELLKVKNNIESDTLLGEMDLIERATKLALSELLGDVHLVNTSLNEYFSVTPERIIEASRKLFCHERSNTLCVLSKNIA